MTKNNISEEELINLLKQRDKAAFSLLYDNYSASLYGIVLRILQQDDETAQDVLQESFVKIWKSIDSYDRIKGTLFTWMLNITRNTAIDKVRSNKRHVIHSIDDNVSLIDGQHHTSSTEDRIGVKEAVSELKNEHQEMIHLAYFGGYTQDEISKKLNMPLGTVKTRTKAALTALRKIITIN
jgi:RNA polymerase sigma-70 factor, ECF subfamily